MPEYLAQSDNSKETLKRDFDLSDVLSITTGLLLSTRGMDGVKDILGFMSGVEIIALDRKISEKCKNELFNQFPLLKSEALAGDVKKLEDTLESTANEKERMQVISNFIQTQAGRYGRTLSVSKISS